MLRACEIDLKTTGIRSGFGGFLDGQDLGENFWREANCLEKFVFNLFFNPYIPKSAGFNTRWLQFQNSILHFKTVNNFRLIILKIQLQFRTINNLVSFYSFKTAFHAFNGSIFIKLNISAIILWDSCPLPFAISNISQGFSQFPFTNDCVAAIGFCFNLITRIQKKPKQEYRNR